MLNIKKKLRNATVVLIILFSFIGSSYAGPVVITIYGKGGATGTSGSGGTEVKVCTQAGDAVCATVTIELPIKENSSDNDNTIVTIYTYEDNKTYYIPLNQLIVPENNTSD
ncbi:MAG: hypothetical protein LBP67_10955 [Bacteroidales bacterium]|jgi:hypothetical protein|nr:hypothetical protein [Bacteroidales bacterium]